MAELKDVKSVFEDIKVEGEWWLPETPQKTIRGTLIGKEAEDFVLNTEDSLEDFSLSNIPFNTLSNADTKYDLIILGSSRRGQIYTLVSCFLFAHKYNYNRASGVQTNDYSYAVNRIIEGAHLSTYEELCFDKIKFGISNFEDWHGLNAFKAKHDHENNIIDFRYSRPDIITIIDNENITAEIEYIYKPPSVEYAQKAGTISHSARIVIRTKKTKLPLEDFKNTGQTSLNDHLLNIEKFIQFAVQKEVYSYDLQVYKNEMRNPVDSNYEYPLKFFRMIRPRSDITPIHFTKMLFAWKAVADDPQKYFQAWSDTLEDIDMPIWLYFSSFDKKAYADQRFMQLVQALEGYHRIRFSDQSIPSEEHISCVKKIVKLCTEIKSCADIGAQRNGERRGLGKWINGKLKYSHEPSLADRLRQLFTKNIELAKWLTNESKTKPKTMNKFAELVASRRNEYAHCLGDAGEEFTHARRTQTIILMRLIFAIILLEETGFSGDKIDQIIRGYLESDQLKKSLTNEPLK
ncbi:hypothetical protein F1728_10075 [Gimesia benthica]|uniref:Uncharacterized protein n=1 Tax=Gimesia benthica TaxID=2608982 RepID=A0A6I6AC87_9PLAN|nr:HEPN domain-containing protein [Gimesia benthica]QGQ22995.1 hypothetical protein F1728_10075 [Gimesia benthica]